MNDRNLLTGIAFALENRRAIDEAALPLVPLMDEVKGWVSSARDQSWGGRSGEGNRLSLIEEVKASQSVVGTSLRAHLDEALPNYVATALRVLNCNRRHPETSEALALATSHLRQRLSEAGALIATWEDVVSAVQGLDFWSAVETLQQLETQLDAAELDGKGVLDEIRRIVQREPFAFLGVAESNDEPSSLSRREKAAQTAASMSVDEILALTKKFLIQPGQTGHVVVWSLYDRALTSGTVTELGPVTLYTPQWAIAVALAENPPWTAPFVEEIGQLWHARKDHEDDFDLRRHVLVRIDLGARSTVGAFEAADDLVETLMDALVSTGSGGRWGKTRWSTILFEGEEWASRFGRGSGRPDFDDTFGMGAVADTLQRESARIAQALMQKPVPPHLREALRLNAEAAHPETRAVSLYREWHNDERTVLLLLDSAFEHIVALGNTNTAALSERISRMWAEASRSGQIMWAIDSCTSGRGSREGRSTEAETLDAEINRTSAYGQQTSLLVAYRLLDRLQALATSPLHVSVLRRTVGQLGSPSNYAAESERLNRTAVLIIYRQRRVRNAITHGNPVTRHVLKTVLALSRFRTGVALRAALDSFADDVPLGDYLLAKEAERAEDAALMRSGMSQVDIWEKQARDDNEAAC